MKHRMNRILSSFLILLLCVGILGMLAIPISASQVSGICGSGLTWTLANGTLTISGTGEMYDYNDLFLPQWNAYSMQVQRIVVESGVTSIGNRAFYGMGNLTIVTLPSSVETLGTLSFAECSKLVQITMPAVKSIGMGCFYGNDSLVSITLPEGLHTIGDQAFYMCTKLSGITIPKTVEHLGVMVFSYCKNLVYVNMLASVDVLPNWTFYGCVMLWEVYLPSSIETVETDALGECPSLNYVGYSGSQEVKDEIAEQLAQPTTMLPDESGNDDVTYIETENATITTSTNYQSGDGADTTVDAIITTPNGWEDVVNSVNDAISVGKKPAITVEVSANTPMPEGALNNLSDREVVVNIHTSENVDWQVIMKDQNADTLKGTQDFAVSLNKNEPGKYADVIGDAESYTVKLGNTTLNSTILIPLGIGAARKVATLYVVDGNELRKLSSVIVDDDGKAAFHVAGTEAGEYVIALNVQNIPQDEVRIPQKLASEYDITYGATLMDAYGNQYVLTGRVNKLGFGIGTLTLVVVGILVGTGILVGVVMVIWNKQKMKFEKATHGRKR